MKKEAMISYLPMVKPWMADPFLVDVALQYPDADISNNNKYIYALLSEASRLIKLSEESEVLGRKSIEHSSERQRLLQVLSRLPEEL